MANTFLRGLLIAVLAIGVGGFGLCALLGGMVGVTTLVNSGPMDRPYAWMGLGIFGLCALLAWLCWRGVRALRRSASEGPTPPPAA